MNNKIISLIGRSNVGKSSIFNLLVNKNFSIVTPKKNTTIRCVESYLDSQKTFKIIDTPGPIINEKKNLYNLNRLICNTISLSNLILVVVDSLSLTQEDFFILEIIKKYNLSKMLIINKIDKIKNYHILLNFIEKIRYKDKFDSIIPMSAINKTNIYDLTKQIQNIFFSWDAKTKFLLSDTNNDIIRDFVRQILLNNFCKEIPYTTKVNVKNHIIKKTLRVLYIELLVKKSTQKKIIIGKNGKKITELISKLKYVMKKNGFTCLNQIKITINKL